MSSFSDFEKVYEKAKQECKLRKGSIFNINVQKGQSNTKAKHPTQYCLSKDLYHLWSGLRDVILLDYTTLSDSDCEDLQKLSIKFQELESNVFHKLCENFGNIRVMKIKFWMFFNGRREEMIFNYLTNIEKLKLRMKRLNSGNVNHLIFVDIDALDRKDPHLESGEKINKNIVPFIQLLTTQVIENIKEEGIIVEIDFSNHLNPSQPFIPFDATLMNGILLNYPIVMFYGSRFPLTALSSNCIKSFHANHVLNNTDLFRYNLKCEQMGDAVLQFVIPQSIHSENPQIIDSTLETWLNHLTTQQSSNNQFLLTLCKESIQYDNIVL